MFSSKCSIVSSPTFRSLINFEFIFLCIRLGSVLISFFYMQVSYFLAPLIEETIFSPLYILASFVLDQVAMGLWVYLWAFYPVPLIYISVFVPVPYCFDDCSFVVQSEVREPDCSFSFSLLLWLFVVFCVSIQIVEFLP